MKYHRPSLPQQIAFYLTYAFVAIVFCLSPNNLGDKWIWVGISCAALPLVVYRREIHGFFLGRTCLHKRREVLEIYGFDEMKWEDFDISRQIGVADVKYRCSTCGQVSLQRSNTVFRNKSTGKLS